jgi:Uma2 family endonuclease
MNIKSNLLLDKAGFLAFAQAREERCELAESRVIMMTGASRAHVIVTRRLAAALEKRLDLGRWTVFTSGFGIEIGPATIRYPDVIVDVSSGTLGDLTATAPVLVAEVTSPSSATYDLGDKSAEYLRLTSLTAYLVLAQDEPKAWVWVRGEKGFSPGPNVLNRRDAIYFNCAARHRTAISGNLSGGYDGLTVGRPSGGALNDHEPKVRVQPASPTGRGRPRDEGGLRRVASQCSSRKKVPQRRYALIPLALPLGRVPSQCR